MKKLLLAGVLLVISWSLVYAGLCRLGPEASTKYCALPTALGNFQDNVLPSLIEDCLIVPANVCKTPLYLNVAALSWFFTCDNKVKIGRPRDVEEISKLVRTFPKVRGVGVGHSWWPEQFCSGEDNLSINIVTTELDSTLKVILNPLFYNEVNPPPSWWPITVDEIKMEATVAAGVPQRIFLDYLANYTTTKNPKGFTIPAFASYIDQTIGGAIATGRQQFNFISCICFTFYIKNTNVGTHGSSIQHKSLSSQVSGLEMVLANGSLIHLSSNSHPKLFKAAQLSVGRLGIVTSVTFQIMPQDNVSRLVTENSFNHFLSEMVALQNNYVLAKKTGDKLGLARILSKFEGTQIFWFLSTSRMLWNTYEGLQSIALKSLQADEQKLSLKANVSIPINFDTFNEDNTCSADESCSAGLGSVFDQILPVKTLPTNPTPYTHFNMWHQGAYNLITSVLPNGTWPRRDSVLSEAADISAATDKAAWDQYEFTVSLFKVGDCMNAIAIKIKNDPEMLKALPIPGLIRFQGQEDIFLSNTWDGPHIQINLDDYFNYARKDFTKLDELFGILMGEACDARLHWGKAGWNKWQKCFDGRKSYGTNWCEFGCSAKALDPTDKFSGLSHIWQWRATKNKQSVPFEQCCDENGFKDECRCESSRSCVA